MITTEHLYKICGEYEQMLTDIRRDFHRHAESGWLEFRTTSKIAEILEKEGISVIMGQAMVNKENLLGYPNVETIKNAMERAVSEGALQPYVTRTEGYTGLCAVIDTGRKGPVTAYRFDIDSNEVCEEQSKTHRPVSDGFRSLHSNETHACGHDGHAAMGIVTALVLNRIKEHLNGSFKIIFQPAEEGVRGGKAIATTGILDDANYFFSGHIAFGARENDLIITNVCGFLATTKIDAHITGTAAHAGAAPQEGNNALLAGACAALNIHAQCQDGRGASRVNVGTLQAGSGRNVVPSSALLKIETRGETTAINNDIVKNTMRTLQAACDMYGTSLATEIVGGAYGGSSSSELSKVVADLVRETMPELRVVSDYALGGSEDVTFMMDAVQSHGGLATYSMFGSKIAANHHSNNFDFDESVMLKGVKIHTGCALKLNGVK